MGVSNRPNWHKAGARWKCRIGGKVAYFPKTIGRQDRPLRDGIPVAAWRYLDALLERKQAEAAGSAAGLTCHGLVQHYLQWADEEVAADRMSVKQSLNHAGALANFLDHPGVGAAAAEALSPDLVDDFFEVFRARPTAKTGEPPGLHHVANVGKSIRAMFRWGARPVKGRRPSRLIAANPLDGYRFPSQPGAVRGYVEAATVRRFLRWAWARARWAGTRPGVDPATGQVETRPGKTALAQLTRRFDRIFILMLRFERLTGCRPGEACGLEWAEITPAPPAPGPDGTRPRWEPALVTVRPEKVKTRRQTDRARKIHVTEAVARLLRAIERLPGRHPDWVFTHMRGRGADLRGFLDPVAGEPWPSGEAASQKVGILRAAAIAAGVEGVEEVGPKKLIAYANRHAYASEGSSLGYSDEQVAEQLGNTPEVFRRVYSHSLDEKAAERARDIAAARRGHTRKKGGPEKAGGQGQGRGADAGPA